MINGLQRMTMVFLCMMEELLPSGRAPTTFVLLKGPFAHPHPLKHEDFALLLDGILARVEVENQVQVSFRLIMVSDIHQKWTLKS